MNLWINLSLFCFISNKLVYSDDILSNSNELEEQTSKFIAEIIMSNLKCNGWNNILLMGHISDTVYQSLQKLFFTFSLSTTDMDEAQIENVVPYHSNFIVMNCTDFEDFERAMKKIITFPYWHPLSNIILFYQAPYDEETVARIFFIYWYYGSPNIIILRNDEKAMNISYFSPYISKDYKLNNLFTCQTTRKIGIPIGNFNQSFLCTEKCNNVTAHYTKIRAQHLGTCIGFNTKTVLFADWESLQYLNLFEDKGKNLHGFTFFAVTCRVLPFFDVEKHENGTYTLHERDGILWNTMAELLNFKIDLTPSVEVLKKPFNFELNIAQVFAFTQRKADLVLFPLYQFHLIVAEIDYTVPFLDSGVCILSHRAGFETIVFDINLLERNINRLIEFSVCFICTWFIFFIYNAVQIDNLSFNQAGKDLSNTFRTVLSISLHNPPKRSSFRIFMTISIWSFFVINFSTQAAIISLFSVQKRDKEVDTFDDIIKKGYKIQGFPSPDIALPDEKEAFRIITSRMEAVSDIFGCLNQMPNDSRRFCLIDCAVGRYLVKNLLDKRGKQFLHLASEARIHSHHLNMILQKNSPLTDHYNKYIFALIEGGFIRKWMDYKYFDRNEEGIVKALGMDDLGGIFEFYCFLLGISFVVFLFELSMNIAFWIRHKCNKIVERAKNKKLAFKRINQLDDNQAMDVSTQTV